jgi:hypothetical protein
VHLDVLEFVISHNFIANILQSSSFLGIKQPEREVDHLSPSRAEFKNEWSYTSTFLHGDQNVFVRKVALGLVQPQNA